MESVVESGWHIWQVTISELVPSSGGPFKICLFLFLHILQAYHTFSFTQQEGPTTFACKRKMPIGKAGVFVRMICSM